MHALPELDPVTGYARLRDTIAAAGQLIVAYSGGVDSALLAYAAHDVLGDKAIAVTAVSASLSVTERRAARAFAQEHGIAHVEVATDELDREEYARNDGSRCFWCKTALFEAIELLLKHGKWGVKVDLDALPCPDGVALDEWLTCFPNFAFLLAAPVDRVDDVRAAFHARDLEAEVIGTIDDTGSIRIASGGEQVPVLDLTAEAITGLR